MSDMDIILRKEMSLLSFYATSPTSFPACKNNYASVMCYIFCFKNYLISPLLLFLLKYSFFHESHDTHMNLHLLPLNLHLKLTLKGTSQVTSENK